MATTKTKTTANAEDAAGAGEGVAMDEAEREREREQELGRRLLRERTRGDAEAKPDRMIAVGDSLFSKIAEAQAAIGVMPKDRTVEVKKNGQLQYTYDYLSESALMQAVRAELTKRGVATFVSVTGQRREGNLTLVEIAVTFADGVTGETFTIAGQGQGTDPSDKGVYKAVTGAVRYALWKCFLVPTEGDDPNQPHEVEATASDTPMSIQDALDRLSQFTADPKLWVKEAMEAFYPEIGELKTLKQVPDKVRLDALKRLQVVVGLLEDRKDLDAYQDAEGTREAMRLIFTQAFDGLVVEGPDTFSPPIPF